MISISTKMTDLPVSAAMSGVSGISGVSAKGIRVLGVGLPSVALLPVMPAAPVMREGGERRIEAPAAVVAEQNYAFAAANGAGSQHTQHTWKWAFRGLEPWSDPA